MSSQDPTQRLQQEIRSVQSSLSSLQSSVRLSSVRDALETLDTGLGGLAQRIADARVRGYPFDKSLEARAADVLQQWADRRPTLQAQVERQAGSLQLGMPAIERQVQELAVVQGGVELAQSSIAQAKAAIEIAKGKVSGAESSIRSSFSSIQSAYGKLDGILKRVDWMLRQLSEASFALLPVESGIGAVRATWVRGEKPTDQDPQGVLFLTDQRLVFEQKQEIATKKVLFITREKEKVQKMLLEAAIGQVEKVTASDRGFMGHQDHIFVDLSPEAPVRLAHFHLDGQDCKEWAGLIGRAKNGDWDQDRVVEVDQAVLDRARTAPTRCPTCGAALGAVVRGKDHIQCEFCGSVVRY